MSIDDAVDAVVIGAGVVGLAAGRALARTGMETLVLERHRVIGHEASSRNSCVIHAGLYYPADSLKARFCVDGNRLLYDYCSDRGIAHRRCGKLIVAGKARLDDLFALRAQAEANGVSDLELLNEQDVKTLEPSLCCAGALLSPSTGIVDVHELMTSLLGDLEANGGMLVLGTEVKELIPGPEAIGLTLESSGQRSSLGARVVINAGGLGAVGLAASTQGFPASLVPRQFFAKGNYFSYTGRPFRRLIYPLPEQAGLGIHATLDLNGSIRFGPDVEWIDKLDYTVDPARAQHFYAAIREYWPALEFDRLQPDYAGIRAKIVGPGEMASDFVIQGPSAHGIPGLVNLFGIESPGLTAALAIGEHLAELLQ